VHIPNRRSYFLAGSFFSQLTVVIIMGVIILRIRGAGFMQQNWHRTARYINPSCIDQIVDFFKYVIAHGKLNT
jgi:hypothetical protein